MAVIYAYAVYRGVLPPRGAINNILASLFKSLTAAYLQ